MIALSEKLNRMGAGDEDWDEIAAALDPYAASYPTLGTRITGADVRDHIDGLKTPLHRRSKLVTRSFEQLEMPTLSSVFGVHSLILPPPVHSLLRYLD